MSRLPGFFRSVVLLVACWLVSACVSGTQQRTELRYNLDQIYPDRSEAIREFFTDEAAQAGVRIIRAMTVGETPKKWSARQSGCAQALFEQKLILINPTRARCLDLDHIAHEIAHIGVLRTHCFGHGDRFYDYNRSIASRFEKAFPDNADRGGWQSPVASVDRRAARYRVNAERCL